MSSQVNWLVRVFLSWLHYVMFPVSVFDLIESVLLENPCNEYSTVSITSVTKLIMVTANFVWFCAQADMELLTKRVLLKPPITDPPTTDPSNHRPLATYLPITCPPTHRLAIINLHQNRRPDSDHILLN